MPWWALPVYIVGFLTVSWGLWVLAKHSPQVQIAQLEQDVRMKKRRRWLDAFPGVPK